MQQPLITLGAPEPRKTADIYGARYEFRRYDDLSLVEAQEISRIWPRLGALMVRFENGDPLTEEEGAELERMLARAATMSFLSPPTEAIDALSPLDQAAIFQVFLGDLLPRLLAAGVLKKASEPTLALSTDGTPGTTSSPVSPDSTVAARSSGRRKSRSA